MAQNYRRAPHFQEVSAASEPFCRQQDGHYLERHYYASIKNDAPPSSFGRYSGVQSREMSRRAVYAPEGRAGKRLTRF
ncbi:hypothetical protein [Polaromonas sp.]|uniref:hypothetical protein n=1 Tax=Polaromonas sp. TaxID=1869339 RepID=UPI00386210C7